MSFSLISPALIREGPEETSLAPSENSLPSRVMGLFYILNDKAAPHHMFLQVQYFGDLLSILAAQWSSGLSFKPQKLGINLTLTSCFFSLCRCALPQYQGATNRVTSQEITCTETRA